MTILIMKLLIFAFLSGFYSSFWLFVVGFFLYHCGLKNLGHYLLAMSFDPFFGLGKNYLKSKCPDCSKCSNCKKWTCSNYGCDPDVQK